MVGTYGVSPNDRRQRHRARIARRKTSRRRLLALLAVIFALALRLKTYYPGDATVRAASESWAHLMFSRSGYSFGRVYAKRFDRQVRLDAKDGAIATTTKGYTVQGKILDRPSWTEDLSLSVLSEQDERNVGDNCYFYVELDAPIVMLYDDGETYEHNLERDDDEQLLARLRCSYFKGVRKPAAGASIESNAWYLKSEPESGGKVLIMSSVTTLKMLSAYHKTLLNHQNYAEDHGYGSILAVIPQRKLEGRSGKFAKHMSTGVQLLRRQYAMVCHVDMDAWFASWDPLSHYSSDWPQRKSLFFGDTGQVWLNSGLMCARSNEWATSFFERTLNAVHEHEESRDGKVVKVGFKRDQPAVWHVLATEWSSTNGVPYRGNQCSMWSECNPDSNPIECWHWCFWDALQRVPSWEGLHSVNKLSNVHLDSWHNKPQMHRMCLASCRSVLSRINMAICTGLTGFQMCLPKDVDKMSMCDGTGCLAQLRSRGGAWLKHTGHQHWRDRLPSCIPRTGREASKERRNYLALCTNKRN